jgi:hypothetical protein
LPLVRFRGIMGKEKDPSTVEKIIPELAADFDLKQKP